MNTTFGGVQPLQYGGYAEIDETHLKNAEEGFFLDRYRVLLFVDASNNVIVMQASLWDRIRAILSNLFYCCSTYAEFLVNVEATLITADEVRTRAAQTAKAVNTAAVDTLDTRARTPMPSRLASKGISKKETSNKTVSYALLPFPTVMTTEKKVEDSSDTPEVEEEESSLFNKLTLAMRIADCVDWMNAVKENISIPDKQKGAFIQHFLKEFEDDHVQYWNLYCSFFNLKSELGPQDDIFFEMLEQALLKINIVVCKYIDEEGWPRCGVLPQKLVDVVLGANNYKVPLTDDTPHLHAMRNFEKNIIDPCGPVTGFDLLRELATYLDTNRSIYLHDFIMKIYAQIQENVYEPHSKFHITHEQCQTLVSISLPLRKLMDACHQATTAEEYLAALKEYDIKFVQYYAPLLLDTLLSIFNKNELNEVYINQILQPYFNVATMLDRLNRSRNIECIKILKSLTVMYEWYKKKDNHGAVYQIWSNSDINDLLKDKDRILEIIALPDGLEMLHFLFMHCNQPAVFVFLENILNNDILQDNQMRAAVIQMCAHPKLIEENTSICEKAFIKVLESYETIPTNDPFWNEMLAKPEFDQLNARYEELVKSKSSSNNIGPAQRSSSNADAVDLA